MTLTTPEKCQLRKQAHALKAVVQIGRHGLTDAVQNEINRTLLAHELIKIQLVADDREERLALIEKIVARQSAEVIQVIGHKITLYRKNPELEKPTIVTPRTRKNTSPPRRRESRKN